MTGKTHLKRLIHYALKYKPGLVCSILAMIAVAALEPLVPALLKPLIDENFSQSSNVNPLKIPILLLTVFLFKGLAEYASNVLSQWVANKVITDIRDAVFSHQLNVSLQNYLSESPGRIISRFLYDIPQISASLSSAWIIVVRDSLILIALLSYLFFVSWPLTLVMLLTAPPIIFLINFVGKKLRKSNFEIQENTALMTKTITQATNGIREIKLYGIEKKISTLFDRTSELIRSKTMYVVKLTAANVPTVQFLAALAVTIVIYLATLLSQGDKLTPGAFVSFIAAMSLMFEPIRRLTGVNAILQKGFAACDSIFEILDKQVEIHENRLNTSSEIIENLDGIEIEFENVSFKYPATDQYSLKDVSFKILDREFIGIVGSTGSGKSTLFNLFAAFYLPTKGKINVNGVSIESLSKKSLREKISWVGQPVTLFDDSVFSNVAIGNTNASKSDVLKALEIAHCMDFVEKLPDGINTIIGPNGSNLSGGQRQRLAIARALLRNSSIYLFDEATSALDSHSAGFIRMIYDQIKGHKTLVVISHDLTTVTNANKIYVFEKGSLVESGAHSELIDKKHYSKLVNK
ncbi:ABC transporter transmembrane domain-containing protein [Betaproteobacteria bacterium]|nr:ABC transporter transmembrane domain-containing protein [Betaproteobacteria bacterium]